MKKIAVILFNLGGPDNQAAVKPFLFNLFHDPAIIRLPQPLRYLVARLISARRAPVAREIYAKLGGGSPILPNTEAQAKALEKQLNSSSTGDQFRTFIAMRYWRPFVAETIAKVKNFAPDEIILLPLYPQFSTTTTQSSLTQWTQTASAAGLRAPTRRICCFPQQPGFIRALADSTRRAYAEAATHGKPRILFSAHGLPEKIIKAGDPYQTHCRQTVVALQTELAIADLDSALCFQSRVGPMKWIGPSTDSEIHRAGQDRVPLVVVPIAFVSDHSETLVEINIEYRHLAQTCGVPYFACVPTVATTPTFIAGLADLITSARQQEQKCVCQPPQPVKK